jgi:hypothetical protein
VTEEQRSHRPNTTLWAAVLSDAGIVALSSQIHADIARHSRLACVRNPLPQWRTLFGRLSDNRFGGNGFSGVFVRLSDDGWRGLNRLRLATPGKAHRQRDENENLIGIERFHKMFVIRFRREGGFGADVTALYPGRRLVHRCWIRGGRLCRWHPTRWR